MDRIVSGVLRWGVLLAAAVTLAGGVWYGVQGGHPRPDYRLFHGGPPGTRSLAGTLRGIAAGHPQSLIQFGALILIATPVARVAASIVSFLLEGDRLYVAITSVVFVLLVGSLTGLL